MIWRRSDFKKSLASFKEELALAHETIATLSQRLADADKRWSTIERDLKTVVRSLRTGEIRLSRLASESAALSKKCANAEETIKRLDTEASLSNLNSEKEFLQVQQALLAISAHLDLNGKLSESGKSN